MKVLVIGRGGREHAISLKLSESPLVDEIYVAPGNPGTAKFAVNVNINETDLENLRDFALSEGIDLTVVGPEVPLSMGIADVFNEAGLKVFGPSKLASRVESSKDYAKRLMKEYNIPTAEYETFTDLASAKAYINKKGAPIVLKEDGLRAGKGVVVCMSLEEAMENIEHMFKEENKVVIEECLFGFEYSLICLVHNDLVVPFEIAQDHKRALDNDEGPNTGGMGTYSPVDKITPEIIKETVDTVIRPMAKALISDGNPFTGFLYGGLMLTENGIKTIEFNARFGDPEAEVLMPRLKSDLVQAILDITNDKLPTLEFDKDYYCTVCLADKNYPTGKNVPCEITGIEDAGLVYHMGTKRVDDKLYSNGGRVLAVTTSGKDLASAVENCYNNVKKIHADGLRYRNDIGKKSL